MVKGPLGREIRIIDDDKNVLVLLGIDGPAPPRDIRISLQTSIDTAVKQAAEKGNNEFIEGVNLTINENPGQSERDKLGGATLHVQQYEVETDLSEMPQETVNAIHNTVVEEVDGLGFNIVGTETTVV